MLHAVLHGMNQLMHTLRSQATDVSQPLVVRKLQRMQMWFRKCVGVWTEHWLSHVHVIWLVMMHRIFSHPQEVR